MPSCGAWFGASTPSADGTYDYTRGLDEYESIVGDTPDILHFYQRGAKAFPTAEQIAMSERPGHQRSLLHFSWKPSVDLTWAEIAAGDADDAIDTVGASLQAYPHRLFLSIHHEPENDVVAEPGSGMTADDYVAMYRHVVGRLRDDGVDNAVYVMTYIGFAKWADLVDELYPGDDVVDWIAYDPYGFSKQTTFGLLLDSPGPSGWNGFYDWATAKAPGKPLMLAEWGFDLQAQPRAATILDGAVDTLRDEFPMIKALSYWNDRGDRVDGRLSLTDGVRRDFATAFTRMANDRYFAATSTAAAP